MIHPKVALPAAILAATGAVLLITGALVHDHTLTTAGTSVLAASGIGAGVGYATPGPDDTPPLE